MINYDSGIFYAHNFFSKEFCYRILTMITPRNELNRGYNAVCHTIQFTDEMLEEIKKLFTEMRKSYPVPPLICKKHAEVLEYVPGQDLPPHYDSPYCKDEFIPFIAVANLNEGYDGGLHFDCIDTDLGGIGTVAFCSTFFMNLHSVKEVKGSKRYSLIFDVNYPEMLSKYGKKEDWISV